MDDLTKLKGIGKATAAKLKEAGITSFSDLAAADAAVLAARLNAKAKDVSGWIEAAKAPPSETGKPARPKPAGPRTSLDVSVVLLRDGEHGSAGDTVTVPADVAAQLRRDRQARRMLLSDLKR